MVVATYKIGHVTVEVDDSCYLLASPEEVARTESKMLSIAADMLGRAQLRALNDSTGA